MIGESDPQENDRVAPLNADNVFKCDHPKNDRMVDHPENGRMVEHNIPKAKYRKKVRERLAAVQQVLDKDRLRLLVQLAAAPTERLERLLQGERVRRKSQPREPGSAAAGQELHNSVEHITMLLHEDVPALLDALDKLAEKQKAKTTNPQRALRIEKDGDNVIVRALSKERFGTYGRFTCLDDVKPGEISITEGALSAILECPVRDSWEGLEVFPDNTIGWHDKCPEITIPLNLVSVITDDAKNWFKECCVVEDELTC